MLDFIGNGAVHFRRQGYCTAIGERNNVSIDGQLLNFIGRGAIDLSGQIDRVAIADAQGIACQCERLGVRALVGRQGDGATAIGQGNDIAVDRQRLDFIGRRSIREGYGAAIGECNNTVGQRQLLDFIGNGAVHFRRQGYCTAIGERNNVSIDGQLLNFIGRGAIDLSGQIDRVAIADAQGITCQCERLGICARTGR